MGRLATADSNVTAKSGLSCYLWKIRRFPMMEPHEEYVLAKRWREHGDHEAAHKLVNSHLRLVAKIARGYAGFGLPISDLISEGNVGLIEAIQRFEPEKGFRLATYAGWLTREPTRRLPSRRATSSTTAARPLPRRSPRSTIASDASSKRVGSPRTRSRSRNSPTSSASRASACARSSCPHAHTEARKP